MVNNLWTKISYLGYSKFVTDASVYGNALKKSSSGIVEFQQNNHLITLIHPKFDCQTLLLISNLQSLFPSTMERDAYIQFGGVL